jgi:integrase
VVAVHAGLRPGELLALGWEDVDLDRRVLHVRRALSDGEFATPKTKRSRRRIDLDAGSTTALRACLVRFTLPSITASASGGSWPPP